MTCSTCSHSATGYATGFIVCEFGAKWVWYAPKNACVFSPVRWKA